MYIFFKMCKFVNSESQRTKKWVQTRSTAHNPSILKDKITP